MTATTKSVLRTDLTMIDKMDPEWKATWLAALRSGEYQQGRFVLRSPAGADGKSQFCCLGVLCDLAAQKHMGSWTDEQDEFTDGINFKSEDEYDEYTDVYPPVRVLQMVNLGTAFDPTERAFGDHRQIQHIIAEMNDGGATFEEIADWIEENL